MKRMKRSVILLLLTTIILSACSRNSNLDVGETKNITNDTTLTSSSFEVGQSMSKINEEYSSVFSFNALSVYKVNEVYCVIIEDGHTVQKFAEFSASRSCLNKQGLELIRFYDVNLFLNKDFNGLIEEIGQPHVDIGSGFYIPSYVTEEAKLISLYIEDDLVVDVIVYDLFSGETTDQSGDGSVIEP